VLNHCSWDVTRVGKLDFGVLWWPGCGGGGGVEHLHYTEPGVLRKKKKRIFGISDNSVSPVNAICESLRVCRRGGITGATQSKAFFWGMSLAGQLLLACCASSCFCGAVFAAVEVRGDDGGGLSGVRRWGAGGRGL
jgi:hypothetical protein